MSQEKNKLLERAKSVLEVNHKGNFTRPAPSLYPHQWNWDTGFIALGLATYDWDRAVAEMLHLFQGQWDNGMLPHILFDKDPDAKYFPGPDFWQCQRSPNAPKDLQTSGITQPPLHAFVIWELYQLAPDSAKAKALLAAFYPKLLLLHRYLYQYRDPNEEGLIHIRHPWESGMANSPLWDTALDNLSFDKKRLPTYQREDLRLPNDHLHRPSQLDYDRYVYLADLFRQLDYGDNKINEQCPFMVQDPLINAILCWSNECLIKIGSELNKDITEISEWNELTIYSMNEKLWNEEEGFYQAYDLVAESPIVMPVINSLLPLVAPIADQEQAERILEHLGSDCFGFKSDYLLCPTYAVGQKDVNFLRYWRGPIWINTNWLLYRGLLRYDMDAAATRIKEDSIELIEQYGFYECYDPRPGDTQKRAYGCDQFSWTAALSLWWLNEKTH